MNEQQQELPKFEEWALVELFGHQRIVGKVSEFELAGSKLLRVDVPECNGEKAFTRFYGHSAIYCISPVTEEIARELVANNRNEPVSRYELPKLAAPPPPMGSTGIDPIQDAERFV